MCTVSAEVTTLKDPPCIWQTSLRGTPKTRSERAGLRLMMEMAQLPRRQPRYGLKPSGLLLELNLNGLSDPELFFTLINHADWVVRYGIYGSRTLYSVAKSGLLLLITRSHVMKVLCFLFNISVVWEVRGSIF